MSEKWPTNVVIYTDGASRGNPGPATYGLQVLDEKNNVIFEECKGLGWQTNNFAEYSAIIRALELAVEKKVKNLLLRTDSELLVKQMKGEYKVKSEGLIPLHIKCRELSKKITKVQFQHVPREMNKEADRLANLAFVKPD